MSGSASSADADATFPKATVALLGTIGGIQVSDPVIAAVSLVNAGHALNFGASTMALAAGISTLALAATVIPGGVIADKFGRRQVLMIAMLIGAAGQIVTAMAPGTGVYLLGRVITGAMMGILFGASYALLREVASRALGPAMGLYNLANILVALTFGFTGGALATLNWRFSFLLLPVLTVICFVMVPKLIPKVPRLHNTSTDYGGMILVGIGVAAVLYGLSNAAVSISEPKCWGPVLVGILAFIAFGVVESKNRNRVFPIKLLSHPAFLGTVIMGIFWNVSNGAVIQMTANFWQYVFDWNTFQVSIGQLPASVGAAAGSVTAGIVLGKKTKIRTVSAIGYSFIVCGLLLFLLVSPTSGYVMFLPGMLLASAGWMANATAQGTGWMGLSPARDFGPVTSSKLTVGQFGFALGLSGSTALVSLLSLNKLQTATGGQLEGDHIWAGVAEYLKTGQTDNAGLARLTESDIIGMYVDAFKTTSLVLAIIAAVAGLAVFVLLGRSKAKVPVEEFLYGDEKAGLPT